MEYYCDVYDIASDREMLDLVHYDVIVRSYSGLSWSYVK